MSTKPSASRTTSPSRSRRSTTTSRRSANHSALNPSRVQTQEPPKAPNFKRLDRAGRREAGGALHRGVEERRDEEKGSGATEDQAFKDRPPMGSRD
ncbi:hypothetical protein EV2_006137 [Malus domestica]